MSASSNLLHCDYRSNCICPGSTIAFVCSVSDGVATVWRGSIFNCPSSGNDILLRHLRFEDGVSGTCNDGAVVAYSIDVTNNSYNSQLNMTVSPEMHNGTVECIRDSFNAASIGTCTLMLVTGKHKKTGKYYCKNLFRTNQQSLLLMFMFLKLIQSSSLLAGVHQQN